MTVAERGTARPILEIDSVAVTFGGIEALRDVSMAVVPGELFGLIGPNGAGKSTLLNCINRFYTPNRGSIRFDGVDLRGLSSHKVAGLGLGRTFQSAHLFADMSVLEICLVGGHGRIEAGLVDVLLRSPRARARERAAATRAREVLAHLNLLHVAQARGSDLPYGLQKRAEMARALCGEPRLLLLDEPAAGLNSQEVDEVAALIVELNRSGMTIVVVEHNMRFIMGICHRICVLHHGRTLAIGTPAEVQSNPDVIGAYLGGARS